MNKTTPVLSSAGVVLLPDFGHLPSWTRSGNERTPPQWGGVLS
jgi:hypothetical protein